MAARSAEQLMYEFRSNAAVDVTMSLLRSPHATLHLALMAAHLGDGQIVDGQTLTAAIDADLPTLLRDVSQTGSDDDAIDVMDAGRLLGRWTKRAWVYRSVDPTTRVERYQLTSGAVAAVRQMRNLQRHTSVATGECSQRADGVWWQVADIADACVHAVFGPDALYLLCRRDAPRGKVLRLPVTEGVTVADAEQIVPVGDLDIEDLAVTRERVWVVDTDGGPQQVRAFDHDGRPLPPVRIPAVSSVSSYFARVRTLGQDRIAWSCQSFTTPATWWIAADGQAPRPTALSTTTPVDLAGYQVTREFATSKDGTRIPLNVIAAPGTPRDGTALALLTAYGGFSISLVPQFHPEILLWLEQGGVYVVANIRGGGEFGQAWHTRVDSQASRTASTTSSPARTTSTAAGSPAASGWQSPAVPTEAY